MLLMSLKIVPKDQQEDQEVVYLMEFLYIAEIIAVDLIQEVKKVNK